MIDDFETTGTMIYKMNDDASVTIDLTFDTPHSTIINNFMRYAK